MPNTFLVYLWILATKILAPNLPSPKFSHTWYAVWILVKCQWSVVTCSHAVIFMPSYRWKVFQCQTMHVIVTLNVVTIENGDTVELVIAHVLEKCTGNILPVSPCTRGCCFHSFTNLCLFFCRKVLVQASIHSVLSLHLSHRDGR